MAVSGKGLALATGGGILFWTGITSPTGNPRDVLAKLLSGKAPPLPGPGSAPGGGLPVGGLGGSVTGNAMASDALTYQGHLYKYGGAPGPDGRSPWDCSSCMNWILGHDFGIAIPGYRAGTYDGSAHGPTTVQYLVFGAAVPRSQLQAGDLCVWQTHMGMATGPNQMLSAQGPDGTPSTRVSGIAGPGGEVLFCRRIVSTASGTGGGGKR